MAYLQIKVMYVVRGIIDLGNISFSEGLKQFICRVFFYFSTYSSENNKIVSSFDLLSNINKIEQFADSPVIDHVHGVADLKSAFRNIQFTDEILNETHTTKPFSVIKRRRKKHFIRLPEFFFVVHAV